MAEIDVQPAELLAAAEPLRRAADDLTAIADGRRHLQSLASGCPSADLRAAVGEFLTAWELPLWGLALTLSALSEQSVQASRTYVLQEQTVAATLSPGER